MSSWRRTYWAVFAANLVTAIGMMSFLPFFPSHVAELGVEDRDAVALWAGVLYGAAPLTAAFAGPVWGALGDRFGRRLMVLRAMVAIAVFVGAMAFATSPWQLLVLRLLQGSFSGFVAPSLTLVSVVAPQAEQGRVQASLQRAMVIGSIAGPAFGDLVRSNIGLRETYLGVSALALVACLLVLLFAREDPSARRAAPPAATAATAGARRRGGGSWSQALGDLGELRGNRGLREAVVLLFVVQLGIGATNPLIDLFVADLGGAGLPFLPRTTGQAFTVMAITGLVVMGAWGRAGDARGYARVLRACAAATGGVLLLHAFTPSYRGLLALRALLGLTAAGAGPLAFGVAAAETAVERRGGAFGVVFSARAFAVALGALAGGGLAGLISLRGLFALCGAAVLAALLVLRLRRTYPQSVGEGAGSDHNM